MADTRPPRLVVHTQLVELGGRPLYQLTPAALEKLHPYVTRHSRHPWRRRPMPAAARRARTRSLKRARLHLGAGHA